MDKQVSTSSIRTTPVSEVMTREVITTTPTATIQSVKEIFDRDEINHIPVIKDDKVVGIISQRDLTQLLHSFTAFDTPESKQQNEFIFQRMLAGELMVQPVYTVHPDTSLQEVARLFEEQHFHAAPVVDAEHENLIGIITAMDLINFAYQSGNS